MSCSKCGRETADEALFCANCGASLIGGKPTKKTQWSTVAGSLAIVAGGLSAGSVLVALATVSALAGSNAKMSFVEVSVFGGLVVLGLLGVVGGIFALRRKHWVIALIGAMAAALPYPVLLSPLLDWSAAELIDATVQLSPFSVLGLAAVVFTVIAKGEFE